MMPPGMGMLGGGQQPLTPAEVAHQVAVATTQQVLICYHLILRDTISNC